MRWIVIYGKYEGIEKKALQKLEDALAEYRP
jgi:hypothetical protein